MENTNMKSPILDVVGFLSLLLAWPWLHKVLHVLLVGEPYARMIGSYGAGMIVVWRGAVLLRRWWRRKDREDA